MSILIKGIEMPIGRGELTLKVWSSCRVEITDESGEWKVSEAVPIPQHGRLIDADAYETLIRGLGNREYRRENGTICEAIKFLHPYYTPTIIEAEEDET